MRRWCASCRSALRGVAPLLHCACMCVKGISSQSQFLQDISLVENTFPLSVELEPSLTRNCAFSMKR